MMSFKIKAGSRGKKQRGKQSLKIKDKSRKTKVEATRNTISRNTSYEQKVK